MDKGWHGHAIALSSKAHHPSGEKRSSIIFSDDSLKIMAKHGSSHRKGIYPPIPTRTRFDCRDDELDTQGLPRSARSIESFLSIKWVMESILIAKGLHHEMYTSSVARLLSRAHCDQLRTFNTSSAIHLRRAVASSSAPLPSHQPASARAGAGRQWQNTHAIARDH